MDHAADPARIQTPEWHSVDRLVPVLPTVPLHGYGPGHRVAHCGSRGGPYMTSGYVLFDAGPAPAEILSDAKRDEPYGPYYRGGLW